MLLTFRKQPPVRITTLGNKRTPPHKERVLPTRATRRPWMEIFISLDNSHIHLSKPLENWVISAFFPVYLLMLFDTSGPMEQPGVHQRAVKAIQYWQGNSLQVGRITHLRGDIHSQKHFIVTVQMGKLYWKTTMLYKKTPTLQRTLSKRHSDHWVLLYH